MDILVADAPDDRPLSHFKDNDLGVRVAGGIFDAQLHVFKKLRVPEGLEVAAQRFFVVGIVFPAEDARFESVGAHPAVADKIDAFDHGGPEGILRVGRQKIRICGGNDFKGR